MYCIYSEVPEYILKKNLDYITDNASDNEADDFSNNCLICWEQSNLKEPVIALKAFSHFVSLCNCNASFHKKCLDKWMVNASSCPICRQKISTTFHHNYYYQIRLCGVYVVNSVILFTRFSFLLVTINIFVLAICNCFIIYYDDELTQYLNDHYKYENISSL